MQFFKVARFCRANSIKKSKYCCHPPFHPPIFCSHSLKDLSPTLPILINWTLLSSPPLSSDPDNPPKFGTCTYEESLGSSYINRRHLKTEHLKYYFEHPGIYTNSKIIYFLIQFLLLSVIEFLLMCFLIAYPIQGVCYHI